MEVSRPASLPTTKGSTPRRDATLTLGLGCFTCSRRPRIARLPGMHPSYCFRGATATHRRRPGLLDLGLGHRAGLPQTRLAFPLHAPHSIAISYTHATLAVAPHPLVTGCAKNHLRASPCPPFISIAGFAALRWRLSPGFPGDFLGRGTVTYPRQALVTTTTPCLRAAMGGVQHACG
jgi:hypothetical protein